ncbi:phosphoenolpyruvate synthase regulatory protein [Carnobacterium divergens]|nr:phosphoenolpyruvate synthase regulatory protein [Carnobacterium divergens]TFJ47733.1 phosphoenolpyruvate synthase regulatory protein [Carnobacterium divergens]TFJ52698.1 phosphoenolpyruvate synthase regulatory protein [Carnobacterium divergens]TFJ58424.1 phosphoenolpyruvate synthase regulatory protein [Carnobacterium divergens]TFJ68488.1 phosphoenolpyruvate synthase regulatory protein [Carnobacterium divergens]
MMSKKEQYVYIISDSVGETANKLIQAALAQFPDLEVDVSRYPFVRGEDTLISILEKAKEDNAMILHTLITNGLSSAANQFCKENNLYCFDLLNPVIEEIEKRTGAIPTKEAGALHQLNDNYFHRISAIEFAVKYDDGKDPKGFLEADIVLLGVSRTSKTPLSMFLANKNLKVANLPLVPEAHIPDQLWKVNPKKIVGLTNDPKILNSIRRERMIAYGLNPDTAYSDMKRIDDELAFAQDLYNKLDCLVINVSNRSIEETAAIILNTLQLNDMSYDN